jgi:hypothetical protein
MSFTETGEFDRDLKWLNGWIAPHIQAFADENTVRRHWLYKWFIPTNVKHLHKFVSHPGSSQQTPISPASFNVFLRLLRAPILGA